MPAKRKQKKASLPAPAQDWRILFAQALAERSITPLEVMTTAMREYWAEAERYRQAAEYAMIMGDEDAVVEYHERKFLEIEKAVAVAVKAAPYMHPRLMSSTNTLDAGPLTIELVRFSEQAQLAIQAKKSNGEDKATGKPLDA